MANQLLVSKMLNSEFHADRAIKLMEMTLDWDTDNGERQVHERIGSFLSDDQKRDVILELLWQLRSERDQRKYLENELRKDAERALERERRE